MTFKSQSRLVIVLVSLAALTLIVFNFYSSKIKSGIRAYINGESSYSKGHKDALLNLTNYLNTQDSVYWKGYIEALKVPRSDNKARHAMVNNENDSIAYHYFIEGKVHPDDIGNIIWMFKNFKNIPDFKNAVNLWDKSETLLAELDIAANELRGHIEKGRMNGVLKQQFFITISEANVNLTKLEVDFSNTLSALARKVEMILNYVNILVTCLIVGSLSAYLMLIIATLYKSKNELKTSYDKVFDLNLELDTFVYSLSHDLRAPLTSLQGLVKVAAMETEIVATKEYISLMDRLLEKQDVFIKDVIALLQRRNLTPQPANIDIKSLIADALAFNHFNQENKRIKTEILIAKEAEEIYNDIVFIKIIINNLISNAFKYSDLQKEHSYVKITCQDFQRHIVFEVEDNGIGISKEFHDKIFEMFYILDSRKRGTGLGLYIIKQSVEKLNGTIKVVSTLGVGSTFTVSLPKF